MKIPEAHRLELAQDARLLLAAIVESSDDAIISKDLSGTIMSWNPGAERMFGYPSSQAVGQPMLMVFPPESAGEEAQILQRIARGERVRDFETVRVRRDGKRIHVSVSISPVADSDGNIVGASTIARDITEQRMARDQLARSVSLLGIASQMARLGGWSIELPAQTLTWSDEVCAIHEVAPGYTPTLEEAIAFYPPEYRDEVVQRVEACLRNGIPFDFELQIVTARGMRIWVRAMGEAVADSEGTILRVQGAFQDISERKKAEQALRESDRELRALAEAMPQMVWMTRPDGWNIYSNQRWVDYTGLSLEESYGHGWSKPFHPEDQPRALHAWQQALAGLAGYSVECRLRRADGSYRWMLVRGLPFRDQEGKITKWMGTCTDIDDLKRAQEAARASEREQRQLAMELETERARLVAAQAVAKVGSWETDFITLALNWSIETHRIFGTSPEHFRPTHQDFLRMVHPDDRDRVDEALRGSMHSRSSHTMEHRILAADGRIKFVEERWYIAIGDSGQAPRAVGTCQDISDRKHAEQALRDNEALFRAVVQNSWDVFHLVRPDGQIVYESPAVTRVLGYLPEEMVGRNALEFVHPDDRHKVVEGAPGAVDGQVNMRTIVLRIRHKDGSWRWVESFEVNLVANPDVGAVSVNYRDVTERLALEERLRQSQRLESIGQLTGGVAHDFNNLLTVILGNAELLADESGTDTRQRLLAETILGAAQRGADLTQRLLAFARKQALDPRVIDVNRLVADLEPLLHRALGEHIEIESVRGAGLWSALVDPAQLENAVLNLCLNARDAMPGGGRLTLETCNAQIDSDYAHAHDNMQPGQYVMLAVSDTGTGIPPEHVARVFEPFFTTKEKGKGTGLGLAMVYGFVKQSGGHASIYSEFGHGTTVKLYLPRAAGQDPGPAVPGGDQLIARGTETILMVEDDDFVRRYAHNQLTALGYTVLAAENGLQALELIRSHDTIDLLFTDVVMPGMSGRELVDEARKLRPGLRVLYTSGYTENAIVHHGRLDPGVLLLGKPYRRADLAKKIREALTQPSA